MTCGKAHRSVAVAGAGAAGTLITARLLELAARCRLPLEITLIDPAPTTGRGPAYATTDQRHLLNVPATRMSATADDPDDFARWLAAHADGRVAPGGYAPRHLYGSYLADHLRQRAAIAPGTVVRVRDRVAGAVRTSGRLALRTAGGRELTVDAAVLATGSHPPSVSWAPPALRNSDAFVADPWAPGALNAIPEGRDVLLVGTGLTMVDIAMTLARDGRTVHAVSRSGLLPHGHAAAPAAPVAPADGLTGCTGLDALRRAVLRHVARTRRGHGDWRPAIDGLRPLTAALWQRLPESDRVRFIRGEARQWEVHRHRMAPATADRLAGILANGRLSVRAGRVTEAAAAEDELRIGLADGRRLAVGAVVNCTGPQTDARRVPDPLPRELFAAGLAAPGPLGLGLSTLPDGRVRSAEGPDAPLWTLGATRRGELWESTAIPEIRAQAAEVAAAVMDTLTTASPVAPRVRGMSGGDLAGRGG
ncbi:FAD/NAD(P)-binding protein [Streptomyces demainii]|uniref:NAD(P)/FAD-binding protein YdhS n=1 Tax=Streptomyces demainii TaxID=588122 RepID=A0ABT9KTV6_9ACTN|nr:FAD/NAD(P)-binding protein [Streptomyces demainii]MDP9611873.1 putative NAD(P)/FAD-binding protein YdhS [Streptomyces demainii]